MVDVLHDTDRAVSQANADAANRIADRAYAAGVRLAVLSPGSRNTPLSLAFHGHPGIEIRVILDERTAGFLALGFARASNTTAALICTSGSALAHYFPALAEAKHSHVAMMVLSADRPNELQNRGAPQTMNQRGFFGDFVLDFDHFPAPAPREQDPHTVEKLDTIMDRARGVPKGPVHINFAFREPLWTASLIDREPLIEARPVKAVPCHQRQEAVETLIRLAQTHEKGVFVCGPYAFTDPVGINALYELAEHIGWPVFAEAASGARFGTPSKALITSYDGILRGEVGTRTEAACIVRFGHSSTSKPLSQWIERNIEAEFFIINENAERYDPERPCSSVLKGQADRVIADLPTSELPHREDAHWLKQWNRWDTLAEGIITQLGDTHFWEGGIARAVLQNLPENTVLHIANSMAIRDVDAFCPAGNQLLRVYVNRGLNGIDGTIATAAGESIAHQNVPTVLLIGDLAFLHDVSSLQAFDTRPATIVVIDNGGGQIFRFLPISAHQAVFEELFVTPQSVKPEQMCKGLDIRHCVVTSIDHLAQRLTEEVERDGLSIIIAKVDAATNHTVHREIWSQCQRTLGLSL
jgi:2-succinyl-5-enolpyruvyl-6-hydroxy-3-cyclohexene-1-carboxylate synthase